MSRTKEKRRELEARWRAIIGRQKIGKLSVAGFCRKEGLAVSTFHWWRRRLERLESVEGARVQWVEAAGPAAMPLGLVGAGPAVKAGNRCGVWIEFATPPAAELLSAALQGLRDPVGGTPC